MRVLSTLILLSIYFVFSSFAVAKSATDEEVRKLIIRESISSYPGNCPCPYNRARNGSRCGKRSAYSRAGGYLPLCYSSDVTDKKVKEYRSKYGIAISDQ